MRENEKRWTSDIKQTFNRELFQKRALADMYPICSKVKIPFICEVLKGKWYMSAKDSVLKPVEFIQYIFALNSGLSRTDVPIFTDLGLKFVDIHPLIAHEEYKTQLEERLRKEQKESDDKAPVQTVQSIQAVVSSATQSSLSSSMMTSASSASAVPPVRLSQVGPPRARQQQ